MDLAYPLIAGSIPQIPVLAGRHQLRNALLLSAVHAGPQHKGRIQRYPGAAAEEEALRDRGGATAVVRQSNTFAGSSLWSPATAAARGHHNNISVGGGGGGGGKVEMNGVKFRCAPAIVTLPSNHALTINGQNNLNRPGMQRITVTASRGSVPPG